MILVIPIMLFYCFEQEKVMTRVQGALGTFTLCGSSSATTSTYISWFFLAYSSRVLRKPAYLLKVTL